MLATNDSGTRLNDSKIYTEIYLEYLMSNSLQNTYLVLDFKKFILIIIKHLVCNFYELILVP